MSCCCKSREVLRYGFDSISVQRIAYTRFHLETGYFKNPKTPVNPV
ncbi:hypothetical protein D1BOALGB6SA_8629 [Olavius sp. associated proteobacterium Delta 1]|nr:hypothetical protein D1BOALGB6SA_8629 [Olavius sp. associated proteobacterium Delta 1]